MKLNIKLLMAASAIVSLSAIATTVGFERMGLAVAERMTDMSLAIGRDPACRELMAAFETQTQAWRKTLQRGSDSDSESTDIDVAEGEGIAQPVEADDLALSALAAPSSSAIHPSTSGPSAPWLSGSLLLTALAVGWGGVMLINRAESGKVEHDESVDSKSVEAPAIADHATARQFAAPVPLSLDACAQVAALVQEIQRSLDDAVVSVRRDTEAATSASARIANAKVLADFSLAMNSSTRSLH